MKILSHPSKGKIIERLREQFGITNFPGQIIQFGENKLRIFSGNLSKEDLSILDKNLKIENIGLYFAKIEKDGIRLTLDGVQLFKKQITKNILEINEKEAEEWFRGNELYIKAEKGFEILKNKEEFLGCGKSTGERITNFVPKERRIKTSNF